MFFARNQRGINISKQSFCFSSLINNKKQSVRSPCDFTYTHAQAYTYAHSHAYAKARAYVYAHAYA